MLSVPDQRRRGHLTNDNAHYLSVVWAATAAWELEPDHSTPTADLPANHILHSLQHTHLLFPGAKWDSGH